MILKFQGGSAIPPLVSYLPVTVTGGTAIGASKLEDTSSKANLTDKDLLGMMEKLNGLPSDIQSITQQLLNFYIDQLFFPDTSNIASKYMQILGQLKVANFNKELFDKSLDIVTKNGGLNEFAINDRGLLYCINSKGEFKLMSIEEIKDSGFTPLTNSELLQLRAYSTSEAFKNEILKVVSNGIGMQAVNELIQSILSKLGKSELSTEAYTSKSSLGVLGGIQILSAAVLKGVLDKDLSNMSIEGLYKEGIITSSLALQANNALSYIYMTLPLNARTLLKLKSDGTDAGVKNLLTLLVTSTTSDKFEFKLDLLKNPDGSSKSGKGDEMNPAEALLLDLGADDIIYINSGTSDALRLFVTRMPTLSKEGKNLGVTTLDKVASESTFGGIFNFSLATVGDLTLDITSLGKVAVETSNIYKTYLPVDQKAASRGVTKPNTEYLNLLEVVRLEIADSNATEPDEINAIYESYGLPKFVDEKGKVNEEFYKPFGVFNAVVVSDALPTDFNSEGNKNFQEISDENSLNAAWEILKPEGSTDSFDSKGFWNSLGFGSYQQMFKSVVYLPFHSTDPTLGIYSGGSKPTESELRDIKTTVLQELRASTYKPQGLLQL